jgi:hypothetical protein
MATATAVRHSPHQNHLLDALPARDYGRVASDLELIPTSLGDVLYESGAQWRYVYFPTTCIISLLYVMEDGASAEIAVVGNEGILGISLFMGGNTTPSRAIVQSAGHAFRLKADGNYILDGTGQIYGVSVAPYRPNRDQAYRVGLSQITQMADRLCVGPNCNANWRVAPAKPKQ